MGRSPWLFRMSVVRLRVVLRRSVVGLVATVLTITCVGAGVAAAATSAPASLAAGLVSSPIDSPDGSASTSVEPAASPFVSPTQSSPAVRVGDGGGTGSISWSVTLAADRTDISKDETANLTAYASEPVDGTGLHIMIYGFSESFAIPRLMGDCSTGISCPAQVAWAVEPVDYMAFVISPDFSPALGQMFTDALATSNTVTIPSSGTGSGGPTPWSVRLSASPTLAEENEPTTLVATANQTVAGTPYSLYVASLLEGTIVETCGLAAPRYSWRS